MKIKAMIFDFDGVIADSVDVKTKAFANLFVKFGNSVVEKVVNHHRNHGGMSRVEKFKYYYKNILNETLSENKLEDLCSKFSDNVVHGVINAPEIKGVTKFVSVHHKDIPCFINSATPDKELKDIIKKRKLSSYFVKVLGSEKSKTDNLVWILENYDFNPEECIFFGDALSDLAAANDCGVTFIGIVTTNESPLLTINQKILYFSDFNEIDLLKIEEIIE